MILIGVTGGIGTGKTTVVEHLRTFGAEILDADRIVHELYSPGNAAYTVVVSRWGTRILHDNGLLDRAAVARIVFRDEHELAWLNAFIHPLVQERVLERARHPAQVLLCCAVPLLYESGWQTWMQRIVAVWCTPEIQQRRLRSRGWDSRTIQERCARQMPMDRKLALADFGIINTGTVDMLRSQCKRVYSKLCADLGMDNA